MKRFMILFGIIAGTIIFCSVNAQAQQRGNGYSPNGNYNNGYSNNNNWNNNNNYNNNNNNWNNNGNYGNGGGYGNGCNYGHHHNHHAGCGYSYNPGYTEVIIVRPSFGMPGYHCRRW